MELQQVNISSLKPLVNNPRKHSDSQVKQIQESMERFGWTNPILVCRENNQVIAGHGRIEAAKQVGRDTVPVVFLDMSPDDALLYSLADNRIADMSSWDDNLLAEFAADLDKLELDLSDAGFRVDEIDKLIGDGVEEDTPLGADEVQTLCEAGDIWHLGQHRVICADSCDQSAVKRLFGKDSPNLMVTDPPYGVEYDPAWRERLSAADRSTAYIDIANDDRADWTEVLRLFPGNVMYVWHGALHCGTVFCGIEDIGFEIRAQIIWVKAVPPISRGHYAHAHEGCFYAVRKNENAKWQGAGSKSTVWEGSADLQDKTPHAAQKPLAVITPSIKNHTIKGDAVYDPFLGSGTTLIAAHQLERVCYGVEIKPEFVDIIIARFQKNAPDADIFVERNGQKTAYDA